jgi:hypothetical protein
MDSASEPVSARDSNGNDLGSKVFGIPQSGSLEDLTLMVVADALPLIRPITMSHPSEAPTWTARMGKMMT